MAKTDEGKEMEDLVDKHIDQLMEHFDSVQVFVTKVSPDGGTSFVSRGGGNWFARDGQVRAWVRKMDLSEESPDSEED